MSDLVSLVVHVGFTQKELKAVLDTVSEEIRINHEVLAKEGTIGMYLYLKSNLENHLRCFQKYADRKKETERKEALEELNTARDEIGEALDSLINRVKDLIK